MYVYDEWYHQACDTMDNLNHEAFWLNGRCVTHVIATLLQSTEFVNKQRKAVRATLEDDIPLLDIRSICLSGADKPVYSM